MELSDLCDIYNEWLTDENDDGLNEIDMNVPCNTKNIEIVTNIRNIKKVDAGADDSYEPDF